ncbi:MAG: sigma-70 family RNA polymerase sigma factor [Cyclobacteriaceae bacterium]
MARLSNRMQQTMALSLSMQQVKRNTFLKEKDKLLSFIRSRVADGDEAEDILQDVFYQFVAGYESIESIDRITSWLYSVARNKIIDRYRRDAVRPRKADLELTAGSDDDAPLTLQEILPDLGNTPDAALLREAIWDEINEALAELPAEQREIFVWNELEEKSFREIAEETGVSINTLLSRKRYAILAMRKRLQALYNDLSKD